MGSVEGGGARKRAREEEEEGMDEVMEKMLRRA
jgi:hypothetical protein